MNSSYWQGVMDGYKLRRAEAKQQGQTIAEEMYGRAERIARMEIELAEAEEKVRARR